MALPMMTTPTYNLTIPSSGIKVRYRPFLVKEEKALLIAQQSEETEVMVDSLKQVIKGCVLDEIDVNDLATFDIEYIFTQLRAKSVGEVIELLFPCDEDHGEDQDKAKLKISIDISKLEVEVPPGHSKKIELFEDVGVIMKYPSFAVMGKMENLDMSNVDNIFDIIASCIDMIYQGEDLYYAKEQSKEELLEFLYNLTNEQFLKLQAFFSKMPKISKTVEYNCPLCGKHHSVTLEGMQSFF
jgi:hypothetical protein